MAFECARPGRQFGIDIDAHIVRQLNPGDDWRNLIEIHVAACQ